MTFSIRRHQGLTILELLVSLAILGLIVTLLGTLLVGARRASDRNEELSLTAQTVQTAVEMLIYDVSLAGYRGVDVSADTIGTSRSFGSRPLEVTDGAGGAPDSVTVTYFEDRYVSGNPEEMTVTYSVVDSELVRKQGSSPAQAVVAGVVDFQVTSWLNRVASEFVVPVTAAHANRPPDEDVAGIGLTLTLDGRDEPIRMTIALSNPQCQKLPCP